MPGEQQLRDTTISICVNMLLLLIVPSDRKICRIQPNFSSIEQAYSIFLTNFWDTINSFLGRFWDAIIASQNIGHFELKLVGTLSWLLWCVLCSRGYTQNSPHTHTLKCRLCSWPLPFSLCLWYILMHKDKTVERLVGSPLCQWVAPGIGGDNPSRVDRFGSPMLVSCS